MGPATEILPVHPQSPAVTAPCYGVPTPEDLPRAAIGTFCAVESKVLAESAFSCVSLGRQKYGKFHIKNWCCHKIIIFLHRAKPG